MPDNFGNVYDVIFWNHKNNNLKSVEPLNEKYYNLKPVIRIFCFKARDPVHLNINPKTSSPFLMEVMCPI